MPNDTPTRQPLTCEGRLIVYARGEGECDLGRACEVYDLRWADHAAYLGAHPVRAFPHETADPARSAHRRQTRRRRLGGAPAGFPAGCRRRRGATADGVAGRALPRRPRHQTRD